MPPPILTITDSHADAPGFRGWMLANNPSLSMLQHPIYDVRVVGCRAPDRWRHRSPRCDRAALLLDLDGTLLDLAPSAGRGGGAARASAGTLHTLRSLLGDALAVVTGRPVETVDALLGDASVRGGGRAWRRDPPRTGPAAGAARRCRRRHRHGSTRRSGWRGASRRAAGAQGARLRLALPRGSRGGSGAARGAGARCWRDPTEFELLPAHMLWEVRPRGADKGTAVRRLMDRAPFAGRLPVFIGDDVTDEDGIAAAAGPGRRRAARPGGVRRPRRRARVAGGVGFGGALAGPVARHACRRGRYTTGPARCCRYAGRSSSRSYQARRCGTSGRSKSMLNQRCRCGPHGMSASVRSSPAR